MLFRKGKTEIILITHLKIPSTWRSQSIATPTDWERKAAMSKYSLASCFSYESASTKVTLALLKSFYFQTAHHGNCQM